MRATVFCHPTAFENCQGGEGGEGEGGRGRGRGRFYYLPRRWKRLGTRLRKALLAATLTGSLKLNACADVLPQCPVHAHFEALSGNHFRFAACVSVCLTCAGVRSVKCEVWSFWSVQFEIRVLTLFHQGKTTQLSIPIYVYLFVPAIYLSWRYPARSVWVYLLVFFPLLLDLCRCIHTTTTETIGVFMYSICLFHWSFSDRFVLSSTASFYATGLVG